MGSSSSASDNAPSDSPDTGSSRETEENKSKGESFERSMSNAERPDRAPAQPSNTAGTSNADNNRPSNTEGGDNNDTTSTQAETEPPEQEESGFFGGVSDFFGGIANGMQDFARANPRVDSHGNPTGFIDADGIQRGEVASRVMSSGTNPEDLANRLGFSSPQDMTASQNTDFLQEQYQADLERRAIEQALNERYGQHPDLDRLIANGDLTFRNAQYQPTEETRLYGNAANDVLGPTPYDTSVAFGDIEYTFNNYNILSAAEKHLQQGDIDGYYSEINKFDPYGRMALDVRRQSGPSGVIAEDFFHDSLEKEGFTQQQIDDFWSKDTRALAWADLAARKSEFENYSSASPVQGHDGVLTEDRIAGYHERAMGPRYNNWTGKVPYETLGRWMAITPQERVDLANEMVDLARAGNPAARAWVEEAINDWDTVMTMMSNPSEIFSTLPDSLNLIGPALGGISEPNQDDQNLAP